MISRRIKGATGLLARDQPQYNTLWVRVEPHERYGTVMATAWEPTPDELRRLNEGESIVLRIVCGAHPPVMLTVE